MIQLDSVSFGYGSVPVLERADLSIGPGLTLVVGPNGCGKSTLLKLMAGVERPAGGQVKILGYDLWRDEVAARRRLAYVPEHPDLSPYASLIEVQELVCRLRGEPIQRAVEVLAHAGLSDRAHASVRELSAGQRRRALLAAAWIGTPQVVLLDEPLELLDRRLRDDVLHWIDDLRQGAAAVIVVSHQVEPFLAGAMSAVTLRSARVVGPVALESGAAASERLALVDRLARGEAADE